MSTNRTSDSIAWKQRLYDAYVSSGHATFYSKSTGDTPEVVFRGKRAAICNSLISRYIPPDRSAEILDIGCGHGALLHFLASAGYTRASGVDSSIDQVNLARKLGISNISCRPALEHVRNLPSESLDIVLLIDVLEHFEKQEMFDLLDEVWRILRPGAICLVHLPNGGGLFGMSVLFDDLTHVLALTQVSATQLFATLGFSQVKSYEEKPEVNGLKSAIRRIIWEVGTVPIRLLSISETGLVKPILSRNMIIKAVKGGTAF